MKIGIETVLKHNVSGTDQLNGRAHVRFTMFCAKWKLCNREIRAKRFNEAFARWMTCLYFVHNAMKQQHGGGRWRATLREQWASLAPIDPTLNTNDPHLIIYSPEETRRYTVAAIIVRRKTD